MKSTAVVSIRVDQNWILYKARHTTSSLLSVTVSNLRSFAIPFAQEILLWTLFLVKWNFRLDDYTLALISLANLNLITSRQEAYYFASL